MRLLVFVQPVDTTTGMLLGAVVVPSCFFPTDSFIDTVRDLGLRAAVQDPDVYEDMWGLPADDEVYLTQGAAVLEAVRAASRYEQSTLN